jgi:hypothetical protein
MAVPVIGRAALTVAAGAASALLLTSGAQSASAAVVSSAANYRGGTAPACIARYVSKYEQAIVLRNTCGKKMHVKVIITRGPDSPCFGMGKGSIRAWKWGTPFSKYSRTVTC